MVVPQLNPDGFSTPDPQRGNIWGLDLNRDYMKLEQPEIRGYVQNILLPWAPHLFVDGHNGGAYPYNLNYQCPSHTTPDTRITELCDERIFPAVDEALGTEGYLGWYYQRGNENRWDVGGSDPRSGGTTAASQTWSASSSSRPVDSQWPMGSARASSATSRSSGGHATTRNSSSRPCAARGSRPRRRAHARGARSRSRSSTSPEDEPVTYLLPEEPGAEGPVREIQSDSLMKVPVTTLSRPRPWAYLLPPDAEAAVDLLKDHGIEVERLEEGVDAVVDIYLIGDLRYEEAYNHEAAAKIDVTDTVTREEAVVRGSYVVRTGQMQGHVAAHLLEAETRDGVVYWNRMDPWIPKGAVEAFKAGDGPPPEFPIWKLMEPTPLPTRLLP